jgi:hypothetical protein
MALAVDHVTTAQQDGGSSNTFAFTVNSGTDNLLLVFVGAEANGANDGNDRITGITYNSVALTKIDAQYTNVTPGGSGDSAEAWYLVNPTVTTANIVISYTGTVDGDTATAIQVTGANQSAPVDAFQGNKGNSANPSTNVTTVANNCLVIDILTGSGSGTSLTPDASQTQQSNITNAGQLRSATSSEAKATAGTVTMSWTMASQVWAQVVVSIAPTAAALAAGFPTWRSLMGAGV